MRHFTSLALLALTLPLGAAVAQTADQRAYIALRASHIGALTPLITPAMISRRLTGAQLAIRYGLHDLEGVRTHAVAGSGVFGVGMSSSVSLTAGVSDGDCVNCSPALMLGFGGDMRVYESGDAAGSGSSLSLAVSGEFGYAQIKPGDASAVAFGVGAPVTLGFAASPGGMRFAPYFTPVFGIGSTTLGCPLGLNCEESGVRWVLGGGIGVWNPLTSVSASVGVNHVLLDGARPVLGVNVQLGGR